ncbi:acyl-CoA dehydratase activase [Synergistes jonesii]|uniref:acyl-CoA dehydratase activase n=1 Tax=Synergistes jonesii TaxID=2754 RepID=UPI0024303884|nr:acyl-CoA dehydratase activase [Synergistes jonesii]
MLNVGVDIGSTATKGALWNGRSFICCITPTGWAPRESAARAVAQIKRRGRIPHDHDVRVTATGYGRNVFSADRRVTEITCHAAGAHYLVPTARTVLDIGGQDSKVISLYPDGRVADFMMNDKCAAGTGRFLQNMAAHLGCTLADFCGIPEGTPLQPISSMCTVFAESEVIGLLARGVPKESICLGLLDSVAQRAVNLLSRISESGDICFTGGCAQNETLRALIEKKTGRRVTSPKLAQYAGAIGAAIIGGGMQRGD